MMINAHFGYLEAEMSECAINFKFNSLKSIARATRFIVEKVANHQNLQVDPILTFEQANAVLFDALNFIEETGTKIQQIETNPVCFSVIRILETMKRKENISWAEVKDILELNGNNLDSYLSNY